MALILCLETATTNCSVALSKDGSVIAIREDSDNGYSHAEKLHVFIQEVLDETNLEIGSLNAVAVSKGPGSYTGLRIGVSAAKGLCYAAELPLISIPTLDALACQVQKDHVDYIIPMLDARRMEVYSKVLDQDYKEIEPTSAVIIEDDSYREYLDSSSNVFLGSGAQKLRDKFPDSPAIFETSLLPSAREMAELAENKYRESLFEDVAYFEPYYLKDFIAG